jgi:hypothetical protein
MTNEHHVAGDLGVYLAGAMPHRENRAVEQHLAACGWCSNELRELREVTALLEGMPPEVLLDGPPDGGDLMLRRAVKQVRREVGRGRRRVIGVAAAVLIGAVGIGGGFVYGQQVSGGQEVIAIPAGETPDTVLGAVSGRAVDPNTGAKMVVAVLPTSGWVRLSATVENIPPGERCQMIVVGKDGSREIAFGWLTGDAATAGQPLSGSALVAPEDVAAVEVQSEDGRTFVRVPITT